MTVGELMRYLKAFSSDTEVVVGEPLGHKVYTCTANTYYPPYKDCTVMVVLDVVKELRPILGQEQSK